MLMRKLDTYRAHNTMFVGVAKGPCDDGDSKTAMKNENLMRKIRKLKIYAEQQLRTSVAAAGYVHPFAVFGRGFSLQISCRPFSGYIKGQFSQN